MSRDNDDVDISAELAESNLHDTIERVIQFSLFLRSQIIPLNDNEFHGFKEDLNDDELLTKTSIKGI